MVHVVGDARLVERESGEAFVALYDRALSEVYSYLYSRLRDRALAEDFTQDVFCDGARRAASGESIELPWLIAVARNKLIDHWRAIERRERRLRLIRSETENPVPSFDVFDHSRAGDVLQALNPTYRAGLVLRHVDGLSVPQVADHLGRTVAATEQILSRARAAFRQKYGASRND